MFTYLHISIQCNDKVYIFTKSVNIVSLGSNKIPEDTKQNTKQTENENTKQNTKKD